MAAFPLQEAERLLHEYGYVGVGAVLALESLGAPVPGESLLIAASAFAAATGQLNIVLVVVSAAIGAIVGDQIGYLIGRRLGFVLLARWGGWIGLTEDRLEVGRYLFARYGGPVVFVGRFIALLRTFAALMAGANRMPWRSFTLWNALGGVAWTSIYGFGTWLLGDAAGRLRHGIEGPLGIAVMAAVLAVLVLGLLWIRRNEARLLASARAAAAAETAPPA